MQNVFFFDLRDGHTNNFEKLSDEKYLLWDKKNQSIQVGDYCLIFCNRKNLLISSKVIKEGIFPKQEREKWYVEFNGKRYDFISEGKFEEFIVFEKRKEYLTEEDLTVSAQGATTLLTQAGETIFKKKKLPRVLKIIDDSDILQLLGESLQPQSKVIKDSTRFDLLVVKKQIILYGPPGTGKTFHTRELAVNVLLGRPVSLPEYEEASPEKPTTEVEIDNNLFKTLHEHILQLEGVELRKEKSMNCYYSLSTKKQRMKGLAWLGFPDKFEKFKVHIRKEDGGSYPEEVVSKLTGYKKDGWGGYPEFWVRKEEDVGPTLELITFAHGNF